MTTWHTDQPQPKDLTTPGKYTVVVKKPGEAGYTMAYDDFEDALAYANQTTGATILLPTGRK